MENVFEAQLVITGTFSSKKIANHVNEKLSGLLSFLQVGQSNPQFDDTVQYHKTEREALVAYTLYAYPKSRHVHIVHHLVEIVSHYAALYSLKCSFAHIKEVEQ
jgi:hypothetical protein